MWSLMLRTPPLAPPLTKPSTNFRPPPAKFLPLTNSRRHRIPPARSQNETYFGLRFNVVEESKSDESEPDDDGDVVGGLASKVVDWGWLLVPFFEAGKAFTHPDYNIVRWITGNFVPVAMRNCHKLCCSRDVPYNMSAWKALELPLRYLINIMHITYLLVPLRLMSNTQAIAAVRRDAVVLSFLWFLYRWKTNAITRELDEFRAKGADSESIASIEESSAFCSRLLCVLALYQVFVGRWDVILLIFLFTAVVDALFRRLVRSWVEQFSGHSSVRDLK